MDDNQKNANDRRIIIIDDSEAIHRDYEKVLGGTQLSEGEKALQELDSIMFEGDVSSGEQDRLKLNFKLDHAIQGKEGFEKIIRARENGTPYSVAFVDMRMPPGWDGMQTIEKIWEKDKNIQIVICSAYADYTFSQIIERVGQSDRLLILKKPFDQAEVYQMAATLSEKWLAEERTRNLLASLENKVEKRTTELSVANEQLLRLNKNLEYAVDEAQCASRAKGRFLATMSHEIRTTLNGIMGASQMLNETDLQESQHEFANIISTSGEALMTIINDILDYSKYETGQLELESIAFSLESLVQDCSSLLSSIVSSNSVTYKVNWDESIPKYLSGDPSRIRQVILNLLNNAFKFGQKGKVSLSCSLVSKGKSHAIVRIEVSDNGIGMNQGTIDRLFSAFMQADSSTTREYGGTGLGLAICKLLADAMDTKIEVSSEVGVGTSFSFNLDLPISDLESEMPTTPGTKAIDARSSCGYAGRKVLLVDDHSINRKLGCHFLKSLGIDVETAVDGREAVEKVTSSNYDLVLMDLQIPEMGCIEATEVIRVKSGFNGQDLTKLPIIALTANAFQDMEEKCLASGMNDFLSKPLKKENLALSLTKWLTDVTAN